MKLALALGITDWEAEFVSLLSHPMLDLKVVRRCVDGVDLLAAVKVHEIDLVVVTDATLRIDSNQIALLQEANVAIAAISNSVDYWNGLGVNHVFALDNSELFTVASQLSKVGAASDVHKDDDISSQNGFVCIASFGGGVGRTFVTKELGWCNSNNGSPTVIVEGDTYGASLMQELNLPTLSKDLIQASQLKVPSETDHYDLQQFAIAEPNLVVVPGPSHSSHWSALRRAQLDRMFSQFSKSGDVIVDLGPVVSSFENVDPAFNLIERDMVAQSALANAKTLVLCALANTVSVTRLIHGIVDNQDLLGNYDVHLVLNRVRNHKSAAELCQLITRHTGLDQVLYLPDDSSALESAEIKCDFLGKLQPKHQLSRQIRALTPHLFKQVGAQLTQIQELRLQQATAA